MLPHINNFYLELVLAALDEASSAVGGHPRMEKAQILCTTKIFN